MSTGRYFAFHYHDAETGKFLGEVTDPNRLNALRLRVEFENLGFKIPFDPNREDGLLELSDGPLFETPMDYNEMIE